MTLKELNKLDFEALKAGLQKCSGSSNWATKLSKHQPFKSETELLALADRIWRKECRLEDYFEAFDQHPRITAKAKKSSPKVISALEMGIKAYERKFGFPFIVVPTSVCKVASLYNLLSATIVHKPSSL